MTAKITISTTTENAHLLTQLAKELGMKKNEVFHKALGYFSDIVEASIINKRLDSIENSSAKIISIEDLFKASK